MNPPQNTPENDRTPGILLGLDFFLVIIGFILTLVFTGSVLAAAVVSAVVSIIFVAIMKDYMRRNKG